LIEAPRTFEPGDSPAMQRLRNCSHAAVAHEGSFHDDRNRRDHEIHDDLAERNPMAAKAVIWRIEQVIARISWFPDIARGVDPMELRVFPVVPVPTSSFTL
jgi:hypothetical protein